MVLTSELGGSGVRDDAAVEEEIQAELWGPPTVTRSKSAP